MFHIFFHKKFSTNISWKDIKETPCKNHFLISTSLYLNMIWRKYSYVLPKHKIDCQHGYSKMYIMGIGCAMYLQYYSQYYCGAINNLDILLFDMYVMVYGLYQNCYYTIFTYNSHMHAVQENSKNCNFSSTLNSCTYLVNLPILHFLQQLHFQENQY